MAANTINQPEIYYHIGDLPDDVSFDGDIAIDTETQGLNLSRDRLCVVQISEGDGSAHLVHFPTPDFDAPNLKRELSKPNTVKIFHFGRFDIAAVEKYLGVICRPVFCTKIASKLTRTYTDRHGLKDLCRELLGVELSKEQQSSDWAAPELSVAQQAYAASDVLYLHALRDALIERLQREDRLAIAKACYDFLPDRASLDLAGWEELDIFAH